MNKPVAIVTGGSRGVGAEVSKLLASKGWNIAITCSSSIEAANEVSKECETLGAETIVLKYAKNTVGPYMMIKEARESLLESDNPSVVNVASIAGVLGIGSSVAYAASKGALINMTKSLARALGPIRINAICPGFIQGDWLKNGLGEETYEFVKKSTEDNVPLNLTCTAEQVAETICYFIESGSTITGETLLLDGGMHLGNF